MAANIRQISKETGFSPATVSNALNRKKGVNKQTAKKIFQVAERLGYQAGSRILGIRFVTFRKNGDIIDDSPFFPAVIEGVERQAKELGYETTFTRLDYKDPAFQEQLKSVFEDTKFLLIVLGTEMTEEDHLLFKGYKGRMILLDDWSDEMIFDGILINNTDSACMAVEYLVEKGHREIGYIKGNFRIKAFQYREYGYQRTMQKYKLEENTDYIVTVGTRLETAYEGMRAYLSKNPKLPTAFFAENDVIALGAMRALKERGVQVPEDISIIGFDDISYGAISTPGLTTIHVYKQEMGEIAVRRLLDNINYKPSSVKTKIQVCTQFVERDSVKDINQ